MVERKIYAVHDRDLKQFLAELNLLDKVLKREIKCPECDRVITLENIGFITFSKGEVKICCDDIECFYKLRTKSRKKKKGEAAEAELEAVEETRNQPYESGSSEEEAKMDEA
jgi:hypothetical protein